MSIGELQREQAHVDRVYARLEVLRARARGLAEAVLDRRVVSTHQGRYERDVMVHASGARLAQLELGTLPLVFGRLDYADRSAYHVGRVAVADEDRTALAVDWRAPVAEPFYRATPRAPLGLARRRHFRTQGQRLLGLDDELMSEAGEELPLVGEAALLSALGRARTGRMGDIVATIQAEQDAIIRAPLRGIRVVQGGPGTGKTAVALHRAAYLLYTHRRALERRGILLVGPTGFFLRYIEDVLPSLGEQGVRMTTLEQILPGLPTTTHEPMAVARLKGEARMADVLAGARREDRPVTTLLALLASPRRLARAGAGILSAEEQALLTRATWSGWTADDLPLLDELADLHPRPRRPRRGLDDQQRWAVERVVEEMASQQAMDPTMREDLVNRLSESRLDLEEDDDEERAIYGHVVVDEAQDLSPMQWRMLRRRCPSGSMTVVGDLAQATGAWSHERWEDAVAALGRPATVAELTVSYRTPEEIMAFADRIRPPGLQPARSVRSTGTAPDLRAVDSDALPKAVGEAVADALGMVEGTVGVIVPDRLQAWVDGFARARRVTVVGVRDCKGIEFDAVVVVEPAAIVEEHSLRALYVALTRSTQRLTIVHLLPLPSELTG